MKRTLFAFGILSGVLALAGAGISLAQDPGSGLDAGAPMESGVAASRLLAMGPSDQVRVRRLDDIALGSWNGVSDMVGSDAACVFSSTRMYTVVARGDGPAGAFELGNGAGERMSYQVEWQDDRGVVVVLGAGQQSQPFSAQTNSGSCSGGTNTVIGVRVTNANALQAMSGSYSGTLIVEISPSN